MLELSKADCINVFPKDFYSYLNASYYQKFLEIEEGKASLNIWDITGLERYRSVIKHFYKDAYIICLVYDITRAESFENLKNTWYEDIKYFGEKYVVLAVVGNKIDLDGKEEVIERDAYDYAKSIGAIFMTTSAKYGDNINLLFDTLIRQYIVGFEHQSLRIPRNYNKLLKYYSL